MTPVVAEGSVIGYQSVRSKPSRAQVEQAEQLYKRLNENRLDAMPRPLRLADQPFFTRMWLVFLLAAILPLLAIGMLSQNWIGLSMAAGAFQYRDRPAIGNGL